MSLYARSIDDLVSIPSSFSACLLRSSCISIPIMHIELSISRSNLTDKGYQDNIELSKRNERVLFLSSTFLYRKEIQYIKTTVENCGCNISYMYHAGQYLPDWHPWESYKKFFVGDKRTNGCREFMAIEFPWLIDVFGDIKSITSIGSKDSKLEIDFPDTYQIMIEHMTGHKGLITIDVVSRKAVRKLELSGENLYITWDGTLNIS